MTWDHVALAPQLASERHGLFPSLLLFNPSIYGKIGGDSTAGEAMREVILVLRVVQSKNSHLAKERRMLKKIFEAYFETFLLEEPCELGHVEDVATEVEE